jgi:hypothetical protein
MHRKETQPREGRCLMTATRLNVLIEAWLDSTIDDAGFAELEAALLESAEVRREFWQRAALHGLLREAVKIAYALPPLPDAKSGENSSCSARWLGPPRLTAAGILLLLGGLSIGSIVTSLALAYSATGGQGVPVVVVHEEGFEQAPAPLENDIPEQLDIWSGDETEVLGIAETIAPRSGRRMLRFVSGHPRGAAYAGRGAEIWRIIDLERTRRQVGSRQIRVECSAFFNGVASGSEPPRFWISAIATDTPPEQLGHRWRDQFLAAESNPASIAASQTRDAIDTDPTTWERLAVTVTVPTKARYLLLHCTAVLTDEELARAGGPRFYVDDIVIAAAAIHQSFP